jgi:hypothetical protein
LKLVPSREITISESDTGRLPAAVQHRKARPRLDDPTALRRAGGPGHKKLAAGPQETSRSRFHDRRLNAAAPRPWLWAGHCDSGQGPGQVTSRDRHPVLGRAGPVTPARRAKLFKFKARLPSCRQSESRRCYSSRESRTVLIAPGPRAGPLPPSSDGDLSSPARGPGFDLFLHFNANIQLTMPQKKTKKQLEAEAAAEAVAKQAELEERLRLEQVGSLKPSSWGSRILLYLIRLQGKSLRMRQRFSRGKPTSKICDRSYLMKN